MTIPGVAELLGLTIASEIGDIARFPTAGKLVGYSGLTPTDQAVRPELPRSGGSPRPAPTRCAGPRSKPPSRPGGRPTPGIELYTDIKRRHGKANPAKAAVARKILIASWHILARNQPFKPSRARARPTLPRQAPPFVWPPEAHKRSEKPGQLPPDHVRRPSAERDLSTRCPTAPQEAPTDSTDRLTTRRPSKRRMARRPRLSLGRVDLSVLAGPESHIDKEIKEETAAAPGGLSSQRPHRRSTRELLRMKVKLSGAFGLLVRRCCRVRVNDVAKCRRQEPWACRAALPFEGLCDARSGVALAPTFGRVDCQSSTRRR